MPRITEGFKISKKDIAGLIKRMLYKYKKGPLFSITITVLTGLRKKFLITDDGESPKSE